MFVYTIVLDVISFLNIINLILLGTFYDKFSVYCYKIVYCPFMSVGLDWIIEFRLKPSTGTSKAIQCFEVKTKSERLNSKNEESI